MDNEAGPAMEYSNNAGNRRQFLKGSLAFFGVLGGSGIAFAASELERDAEAVVGSLVDSILQLISVDGDDAGQERRLMAAMASQTDLGLLARMTLGRHWRQASARQRDAFVNTFSRYLLHSFATRLRRYAGADLDAARNRFLIVGTQEAGRKDIVVRSRVTPPSGPPLDVNWRLRPQTGRLVIIDLVVEGVSLLITQRSEFGTVLERIGIDGLIDELESRVSRAI